MRTSLTIDDDTYAMASEMAKAQGRTTANLLQHLIRTNNEVVGWRAYKRLDPLATFAKDRNGARK